MSNRSTLPAFLEAEIQEGKSVELCLTIAGEGKLPIACSPRLVAKIKGLLGEPLHEKPVLKADSICTKIRSNIGCVTYYHAYSPQVALSINKVELAYIGKKLRQSERAARVKNAKAAKRGHYLGPNQRTVAPPRQSDPGIPFIGNVPPVEWENTNLRYWVISPHAATGMSKVLPAGTGVALRELRSSKELVEGAVYVYWVDDMISPIAGRLLPRTRDQLHLRLRYDDEAVTARIGNPTFWIKWKNPSIHICQVVYYTSQPAKSF